jgi:hypothetical protein
VGGYVQTSTLDGATQSLQTYPHGGRKVLLQTPQFAPGQRHTLIFHIVSGPGQTGDPSLRTTPGANGSGIGTVDPSACS